MTQNSWLVSVSLTVERNGMVYGNSVCGEKFSGDVGSVLDLKEMFLNLIEYEGLSVECNL